MNPKLSRALLLLFLLGSLLLVGCQTAAPPTGVTLTVTGVSPASGPVAGGTAITITGTGFVVGVTVNLVHDADVHPASGVAITSSTSLTATVPAHPAGVLGVVVAIPGGASATLANAYTYVQDPTTPVTVTSVTPNSGLVTGGTSVTIAGSGFAVGPTVTFGGTAATGVAVTSTGSLTATVPAHAAGAVDVVVTNPGGQSGTLANGYTFVPEPTQLTKADWQVDFVYLGGSDRLDVRMEQNGAVLSGSGRDNNAEVDFVTSGMVTANSLTVTFTLSNGGSPRGSVTCTGTIDAGPPQTISGTFTSPDDVAVDAASHRRERRSRAGLGHRARPEATARRRSSCTRAARPTKFGQEQAPGGRDSPAPWTGSLRRGSALGCRDRGPRAPDRGAQGRAGGGAPAPRV